jgi:hypothetical protein
MLVSWYPPTLDFSPWPCIVLLIVLVPISIWHERHWRATLVAYAALRREAGAGDDKWPSWGLARLMGVEPGLVLTACGMLGAVVLLAAAAIMTSGSALGFDLLIGPLDLLYLWTLVVAGAAAVVAGVAIAIDLWRNPWSRVGRLLRRAIHARPDVRAQLLAQALVIDPGLRSGTPAACPQATSPAPSLAAQPAPSAAPATPPAPDEPARPR